MTATAAWYGHLEPGFGRLSRCRSGWLRLAWPRSGSSRPCVDLGPSVVLLRRRVLSIMSLLFAAADSGDLDDIVRLSPELRSELWCLVCLGPLICVDLRGRSSRLYQCHGRLNLGRRGSQSSGAEASRAGVVPPFLVQGHVDALASSRPCLASGA